MLEIQLPFLVQYNPISNATVWTCFMWQIKHKDNRRALPFVHYINRQEFISLLDGLGVYVHIKEHIIKIPKYLKAYKQTIKGI